MKIWDTSSICKDVQALSKNKLFKCPSVLEMQNRKSFLHEIQKSTRYQKPKRFQIFVYWQIFATLEYLLFSSPIISGHFFCHLFPSRCCDYWLENTLIPRSTPLLLIIFIDWEGEIRFWRCAAASYCLSVHLARRPMPSRCKPPQERDPDGAGWKIEPNICNPNPFTWAHPSGSLVCWIRYWLAPGAL